MNPVRLLAAMVRRWRSRRAARKLLAARLPRGLSASTLPRLELALRIPARVDPPAGEVWTLPVGAELVRRTAPRRLLRLSALPPPLLDPGVVRVECFRLEPGSFAPANETVLPLPRPDPALRWVSPALRREKVDLPWMARHRIRFLGPMQAEWFAAWWEQSGSHGAGAKDPRAYDLPRELGWALEVCKEQMLIRRDVKKDEAAPQPQKLAPAEEGQAMAAVEPVSLAGLIPEKEWLGPAGWPAPPARDRSVDEAWLQRRTLMRALEDR